MLDADGAAGGERVGCHCELLRGLIFMLLSASDYIYVLIESGGWKEKGERTFLCPQDSWQGPSRVYYIYKS
jgi:hypothetical protein